MSFESKILGHTVKRIKGAESPEAQQRWELLAIDPATREVTMKSVLGGVITVTLPPYKAVFGRLSGSSE